jgi:hypothetical protein
MAAVHAVENAMETGKDLVVLYASSSGQARTNMITAIKHYRDEYRNYTNRVGMFMLEQKINVYNDQNNIGMIGTITENNGGWVLLDGVKVRYQQGVLSLDNLYEQYERPGYHPRVRKHIGDNAHPELNRTLADLDKAIEKYREMNTDGSKTREIIELIRIRNNLYLDRRVTLIIGGKSYENISLVDVVEDCVKACRKSIEHGCAVGGLVTTTHSLNHAITRLKSDVKYNQLEITIATVLRSAFRDMQAELKRSLTKTDMFDKTKDNTDWQQFITSRDNHVLIQPYETELEILGRVEEVLSKFFYTRALVIQNA